MDNNAENELDIVSAYHLKFKDANGDMQELPIDATTVKGIDVTDTANLINGAGFISVPIPHGPAINGIWRLSYEYTDGVFRYSWVADTELNWHVLKLDNTWPLR